MLEFRSRPTASGADPGFFKRGGGSILGLQAKKGAGAGGCPGVQLWSQC